MFARVHVPYLVCGCESEFSSVVIIGASVVWSKTTVVLVVVFAEGDVVLVVFVVVVFVVVARDEVEFEVSTPASSVLKNASPSVAVTSTNVSAGGEGVVRGSAVVAVVEAEATVDDAKP